MSENFECLYHGDMFPRRQVTPNGSSSSRWSNDVNFQAVDELARNLPNNELNLVVMEGSKSGIKVELQNENLWRVFREKETEMIITRAGRRMFPILDFSITGLESNTYYSCMIQITSADNYHYRFDVSNEKWLVTGEASKPEIENNNYMHPHGSALGKVWMSEGARFDKVKLSNHYKQFSDFIILTSLQRYKAQLVITKIGVPQCERWIFDFPETAFTAVTCYQNPSITKLKIDYNPFAKAFRQSKRPAKQSKTIKSNVTSSSQRSSKRPRFHLSSPPPVTRLQPPPLGHFSEEVPGRTPSPPPPPPPLNLYCQSIPTRDMLQSQEEMAMQSSRCIPLVNDPILWEPSHPVTSHRTCLPPISTSFRFDAPQPQLFFKPDPQSYYPGWHTDYQYQDHYGNHCGNGHCGNGWMTGGFGGLFDEVQLRHHGYDSRLP